MRFDQSNDGFLQLEEITAGLKEVLGHVRGSLQIFEEILQTLDKNLNGKIDYTEFLTAAADKEQLLVENNLRFAFNMFDSDHNGYISRVELRRVFETAEKKDEELWNEIFTQVDIDGDGQIIFEEFRDSMQQVAKKTGTKEEKYLIYSETNDQSQTVREDNEKYLQNLFDHDPKIQNDEK